MPGYAAALLPAFASGAWVWLLIAAAIAGGLARGHAQAVAGAVVAACVGFAALMFEPVPAGLHPDWAWRAMPVFLALALGGTYALCLPRLRRPRPAAPPPSGGTRALRALAGLVLGGIGGAATGVPAGLLYVDWAQVSGFEGASGYAVLGVALLFCLLGAALGAVMGWRR